MSWWVILDRPPAVDFDSTMPFALWNEAAHDLVPEMRVHVPHASRSVKCAAAEYESIIPLDRLVGMMVEACCSMRPGCPCYLLSAVFRHHHYVRVEGLASWHRKEQLGQCLHALCFVLKERVGRFGVPLQSRDPAFQGSRTVMVLNSTQHSTNRRTFSRRWGSV